MKRIACHWKWYLEGDVTRRQVRVIGLLVVGMLASAFALGMKVATWLR